MNRILLVLKNELISVIGRRSFWLTALGLPVIGALVFAGVNAINNNASVRQSFTQALTNPQDVRPEGYVDLGGIIKQLPPSVPAGAYIPYADEAAARSALQADQISAFYVISADYLQTGKVTYIRPDFNPLASSGASYGQFLWMIDYNLSGKDEVFANLVHGPMMVDDVSQASPSQAASVPDPSNNPMMMWIPYAISLLTFGLIIGSSSLLLSSVSKEKENRIMEVLLTSVKPRQLLTGKIVGLGIAGLVQAVIWFSTSYVLLRLSGRTFQLPSEINISISFLIWGIVYFLLGYAVYASLMAGLGALVPNLREASQATIVLMIPMMIPMMLSNNVFAQAPNGVVAVALSLFPLSAPIAMPARLSMGGVAWWQPILAAVLLAFTAWLILRAVARMFRAQSLLAGQTFKLNQYFRALLGRES